MSRRLASDDLEIFSYSFLDVLACSMGALAFILLMILFVTRDLVERSLVEDGAQIESMLRAQVERLEYDLRCANEDLVASRAEALVLAEEISMLEEEIVSLRDLTLPGSFVSVASVDGSQVGRYEERLFHSEDRRVITCGGGKVVLGSSGVALDVTNRAAFVSALWLYMEYYDQRRERLWLVEADKDGAACEVARGIMTAAAGVRGQGLRSMVEEGPPANAVATEYGLGADTDHDGVADVRYEIPPGKEGWSRKLVDRGGPDGVFEEAYLDYDAEHRRWRQKQVDTDGDGVRDVTLVDSDPSDDDWEILRIFPSPSPSASSGEPWGAMYEDTNGDGRYDKKVVLGRGDRAQGLFVGFDASTKRWDQFLLDVSGDGRYDGKWKSLSGDGS